MQVKAYGEVDVQDTIAGAEALLKNSKTIDLGSDDDDSASNDGEWVNVSHSEGEDEGDSNAESDDDNDSEDEDDVEDDNEDNSDDDEEEVESDDDEDEDEDEDEAEDDEQENEADSKKAAKVGNAAKPKKQAQVQKKANSRKQSMSAESNKSVTILDEKQAAQELALTRIFTDEDFKRINNANLKKTVTNARKRPLEREQNEFVKLDNIEMIYKKRKHDKETRLETVKAGREGREKFGWKDGRKNENSSKTNREKRKTKNFGMLRYKARSKLKKSFKDKQQAMRKHLLQQKKMK